MMGVIDVHPRMPGATAIADHIEVTCVPSRRTTVCEALQLVEERVRSLTVSDDSGLVDITTTTGQPAEDEREGFRLLFEGVMLRLRNPHGTGKAAFAALDEALERLAIASVLMRRLDPAEDRLDRRRRSRWSKRACPK